MDLDDVLDVLEANFHCVIASSSPSGEPWVSPVFFNYTRELHIVFESARDSRHARLLAENPRVAIVVADLQHKGSPRGVYLECAAREVTPEELPRALDVFLHGPHEKHIERTPEDYLGGKPIRLYEARPQRLFYLTQVTTDGYELDERVELPLPFGRRTST